MDEINKVTLLQKIKQELSILRFKSGVRRKKNIEKLKQQLAEDQEKLKLLELKLKKKKLKERSRKIRRRLWR